MHEHDEQPDIRKEGQRNSEDGVDRVGSYQGDSKRTEHEGSQGAIDSNSSWSDQVSTYVSDGTTHGTRQEIIGGILRQLRNLQTAHLAYVKAHKERLESRLKENESHQENVAREMQALEEVVTQLLAFEQDQTDETL